MIQDHRIRDDRINGVFGRTLGLAHAIPDDFTAAELHLFSVNGEVFFDLDYELGISQTDSIAHRWTEHFCVRLPGDLHGKWESGIVLVVVLVLERMAQQCCSGVME